MKKVYLDHNATTPVHPEVMEAMKPYFMDEFGNPSSLHGYGRKSRVAIESAREKIAGIFKCLPQEIIFTSGGTESNNLAIKGIAWARKNMGRHIITSTIEHHAVLEPFHYLERNGFEATFLEPDSNGRISVDDLKNALRTDTILVSIIHANNETGTIQDIAELAEITHKTGALFHTDAVQSTGKIPYEIDKLGVDILSVSGHKLYAPKGVGLLYLNKKVKIQQLNHGGSHESNRRAGTENVPGIVGLAKAIEIAWRDMDEETERLTKLTGIFTEEVKKRIPDITIIGDQKHRVPNTVSIAFSAVEGESILLSLDLKGIAVSAGSACASGETEPSHVILAMGVPPELAQATIRFSFGRLNDFSDIDYVLDALEKEVDRLRSISPLYHNS